MSFQNKLFLLLLIFISATTYSQDSKVDSLKAILEVSEEDSAKVDLLLSLSLNYLISQPDEAINYCNLAIDLSDRIIYQAAKATAYKNIGIVHYYQGKYLETISFWQESSNIFESIGDKKGVANLLTNLAAVNSNQGDDTKALELNLEALDIAEEINDTNRIVTAQINIGEIYLKKEETHDKALDYSLKAITLCEISNNKTAIGIVSLNIGEIFFDREDYATALSYYEKSYDALEASGNIFHPLNNIGKVYAKKGDFETAIKYQKDSYERAEKADAKLDMSRALLGLADTYLQMGDYPKALSAFNNSKSIAAEIGSKFELRDSYLGLANSYAKIKDYKNAFLFQSLLTDIKDTLYNISNVMKIGVIQLNYDIDKKQSEINLLTKDKELQELAIQKQRLVKNTFLAGLVLIFIIAFIIFRNYLAKVKINKVLDKQKDEIETLLLNILPKKIAKELRINGRATPRDYKSVSVLFTDFKDFTKISSNLSPGALVAELNDYFIAFDKITVKYNLEKIKTIGDAYMCAGGLPTENDTHPVDTILAALEMQKFMDKKNKVNISDGKVPWGLRVGIHTGPVMAGVVGSKKYAYDIWGSTVNVASRMESNGEAGKVNISAATYDLVKNKFECHHRGKIMAKNVGEVDMYFIEKEK